MTNLKQSFCSCALVSALALFTGSAMAATGDTLPYPNVIGGSIALVVPFSDHSVRVGEPVDIWGTRSKSLSLGAFYYRKLTQSFWVGATIETESVKATFHAGKAEGQRNAIGITWLGHYPEGIVSVEAGGFGSLGLLKPTYTSAGSSADWSTLKGMEFGMMIGPALEVDRLRFSARFEPIYCWYRGDSPKTVLLADPRFKLNVSYAF